MDATRTVLLAEDDDTQRDTLVAFLAKHGYEVVAVANGTDALAAAAARLPGLAILDMMLPGESGLRVARAVKDLSDDRVPVIMVSGNASAAHRDYALSVGVDAFLPKPYDPDNLLAAAESLCPPLPWAVIRPARAAVVGS